MAGSVDQVEFVFLTISRLVCHPDGVELDGDTALPLQIHRIQELLAHQSFLHRPGGFDQPVGQRTLAVVDVSDDAEIANSDWRMAGNIAVRGGD